MCEEVCKTKGAVLKTRGRSAAGSVVVGAMKGVKDARQGMWDVQWERDVMIRCHVM